MSRPNHFWSQWLVGLILTMFVQAPAWADDTQRVAMGSGYRLSWLSVDGGGTMNAEGGGYRMAATLGQADAGSATDGAGGDEIATGFWGVAALHVSSDDFESGDLSGWSAVVGQAGSPPSRSDGVMRVRWISISQVEQQGKL